MKRRREGLGVCSEDRCRRWFSCYLHMSAWVLIVPPEAFWIARTLPLADEKNTRRSPILLHRTFSHNFLLANFHSPAFSLPFPKDRIPSTTQTPNLELDRLQNMKQLSLSGVWLLSSILIMLAGLWRRVRNLRLVATALFGFTILKIFIYDLSFLQTLYRIFSFMGLGVILLGVSYLYQKTRGLF